MNIVLTGLNGYGGNFIKEVLSQQETQNRLIAVVSGNPTKSIFYHELSQLNIKFYPTIEDCLVKELVHLVIIATPMHIHEQEVTCALNHGVSVYCEKPLAPTVEACHALHQLAIKNNCYIGVGFQWSFSKGILDLKKDLIAGRFGKIHSIKTLVTWNRRRSYYSESTWKGRLKDQNNHLLYECLISNAAAHYLHNMLFLAGDSLAEAASPTEVIGECYVAHDIETFDTTSLKIRTSQNIDLLFVGTLVAKESQTPRFQIICENAII